MSYGKYEEAYGLANEIGGPKEEKELPDLDLPDDCADDEEEEEPSEEETEEDLPSDQKEKDEPPE